MSFGKTGFLVARQWILKDTYICLVESHNGFSLQVPSDHHEASQHYYSYLGVGN